MTLNIFFDGSPEKAVLYVVQDVRNLEKGKELNMNMKLYPLILYSKNILHSKKPLNMRLRIQLSTF